MKRNAYTMRDVARLAGVSISTVSAVINNKNIVSPELTERVQSAISAMNFSPHGAARGLRSGRSHIIGLVIPDITNPFFVEIMRGVEDEAIKNGYEVMVCNSNDRSDLELRHLNALHSQRADGILLAPSDSYAAREIPLRDRAPTIFVDCVPMRAIVDCVVTDNFEASYEAIRYLIGLGHQKIAVISGKLVHSTSVDRVEGCRKAMQEMNLPTHEEALQQGDSHINSGYRVGLSLLQSPEPPTAIFTLNNRMALGILRALRELNIPCPERVSLMSFDDADWAEIFTPSLTAIEQPTYEIGTRAVQLLLQSIQSAADEAEVEPQQIVLKSSLRIRGSTAAALKSSNPRAN
ncbi:MAG: LacI family DNA-binding transcriptional regulator [Terriglobales bacterium]